MNFLNVSDVLIDNVHIEGGSDTSGDDPNIYRNITATGSSKIVFYRCSFRWAIDQGFSHATGQNITMLECLLYEPFQASVHYNETTNHYPEVHGLSGPYGEGPSMTIMRSLIARSMGRNPEIKANANVIEINNVLFNGRTHPGGFIGRSGYTVNWVRIGCWAYRSGPYGTYTDYCGYIYNVAAASKIYVFDLACKEKDDGETDDWKCLGNYTSHAAGNEAVPPLDISAYPVLTAAEALAYILANAGPKYPDSHNERIKAVVSAKDMSMEYINDVLALPARVVDWGDSAGRVDAGYDWSANPQQFDITVNGDGPYTCTLNANCADIDEVVAHKEEETGD